MISRIQSIGSVVALILAAIALTTHQPAKTPRPQAAAAPAVIVGAATPEADPEDSTPSAEVEHTISQSRMTPVRRAVHKVRDSVVTLKVVKPRATKDVTGTGIIIDERGFIVTNYHVIENHTRIKVHLRDGTELEARVRLELASHDLAVVQVYPSKPLKAVALGPAADVDQGVKVLAIGSPYGYSDTVTVGHIGHVGRRVNMQGRILTDLIQHDAAINPGNSGGALINIHGELIGINVALRRDANGLAFALNADQVQRILSRHLSAHKLSGIRHGLLCREEFEAEKFETKVIVDEVDHGTPAADAGLREGDVILAVADREVGNRFDVERSFWEPEDETVKVKVIRNGFKMSLSMRLSTFTSRTSLTRR